MPNGFRATHFVCALLALVVLPAFAAAAGKERRVFAVSVGGKPAGSYTMLIHERADGSVAMTAEADVSVRIAIINYRYTFRGTEVWKDGRLASLETATEDGRKKHSVSAAGGKDGAAVRGGGNEVFVRGHVWPTTFWKLPDEKHLAALAVVDADTGKLLNARVEKVGPADLSAGGRPVKATRWRIGGALKAELWFDESGRLVRQESVEDGHRTVLELTRIERE